MNNKAYTIFTNLTKFLQTSHNIFFANLTHFFCKPHTFFANLTHFFFCKPHTFFANLIIFVYAGTVGTATEDREGDDKPLTSGGQIAIEE